MADSFRMTSSTSCAQTHSRQYLQGSQKMMTRVRLSELHTLRNSTTSKENSANCENGCKIIAHGEQNGVKQGRVRTVFTEKYKTNRNFLRPIPFNALKLFVPTNKSDLFARFRLIEKSEKSRPVRFLIRQGTVLGSQLGPKSNTLRMVWETASKKVEIPAQSTQSLTCAEKCKVCVNVFHGRTKGRRMGGEMLHVKSQNAFLVDVSLSFKNH